ncbi:hypothetical protein F5B18DRAFT_78484 [Nemania serpens]|nr:hypothetical protein F5B18DRAFT_78484 [Nemania serpens]
MEYCGHCFFDGWHFLYREIGALHGSLQADLTRALPARVCERQSAARKAFHSVVGPCAVWKTIRLYGTIRKLVALTNTLALLRPELGADTRWANVIDMFAYSLGFAIFVLSLIPRLRRTVARYAAWGPNWFFDWRLERLAYPVVKQDLRKYRELERSHAINPTKTVTEESRLGTWLTARYRPQDRTADMLAHGFIVSIFESMTTTICTLYFILSELAIREELVNDLLAEIKDNLVDGQLPMSQLNELRKMDSFMRESSRANVFGHYMFNRPFLPTTYLCLG